MRKLLPLLILPLVFGCHGRFKKNASTLGAARAEVITVRGPSVATPSSGGTGIVAAAFDITQAVRAGNIAAHISSKVDPEQVNDAFVRGFADQLGDGPPFAYDANARPVKSHWSEYRIFRLRARRPARDWRHRPWTRCRRDCRNSPSRRWRSCERWTP